MPKLWEERVALFVAYLVEFKNIQSSTLRSYVSAIKFTLKCDNYKWQEEKVWLHALFRSCKQTNDTVGSKFPIHFKLLEIILFEVERKFDQQPYLMILYKAIFSLAYYGLMRIGEIINSTQAIKAANIQIASNKNKIRIILYSSQTHGKESRPQIIKISARENTGKHRKFFCSFNILRQYMSRRGNYSDESENFFVFADKSIITQQCLRNCLKSLLISLNLNTHCFSFHSYRVGRATDFCFLHRNHKKSWQMAI